jgi:hypothetical protein
MKKCFDTCVAEADKLDRAVAKHFSKFGTTDQGFKNQQRQFSQCGKCKSLMDLKVKDNDGNRNNGNRNESSRILYCNICKEAHILPIRGEFRPHELSCLICQYQVLNVKNLETNKEHTVCPYCFK